MLAFYYFLKENFNASANHLKISLDLEPSFTDAIDLFKIVRCKIRVTLKEDAKTITKFY